MRTIVLVHGMFGATEISTSHAQKYRSAVALKVFPGRINFVATGRMV
jgi:hypothetical protein